MGCYPGDQTLPQLYHLLKREIRRYRVKDFFAAEAFLRAEQGHFPLLARNWL